MNAPFRSTFAAAVEAFVGILRFRKGPEDVPASRPLLAGVVLGQVLLGLLLLAIPPESQVESPLVVVALELGVITLGVLFILRMAGFPERFTQTVTAIFGVQLVLAPLVYAARWLLVTYQADPVMQTPALFISAVIAVWLLVVTARILRSATGYPLFTCVFLVIGLQIATLLVVLGIFPPPLTDVPAPT